MRSDKKYFAFISYSSKDSEMAEWLQKKIEFYKLPTCVFEENPKIPKYIRPIFRDKTDLEPGYLSDKLCEALQNSKYLIVLCSTNSAQSKWVNIEIEEFLSQKEANYIIPFIIEGEPYANDPNFECYPQAIKNLKKDKEIIGVNINEISRDYAVVKLIASMLDLDIDSLWQRYLKEEEALKEKLLRERIHLQKVQSRYLSEKSHNVLLHGDSYLARMLALEALPKKINGEDERPLIPEAEQALREAEKCSTAILKGHTKGITCVTTYNDYIISGSIDRSIRIWEKKSGTCIKSFCYVNSQVTSLYVYKDFLYVGYSDGTMVIGNLLTYNLMFKVNINLSLSSNKYFTCDEYPIDYIFVNDKIVIIHAHKKDDIYKKTYISYFENIVENQICDAKVSLKLIDAYKHQFLYRDKNIYIISNDSISILDKQGNLRCFKDFKNIYDNEYRVQDTPSCAAFNGRYLILGYKRFYSDVIDLKENKKVCSLDGLKAKGATNAFVFYKDYLFEASDNGCIQVWDIKTFTCLKVLHGHTGTVTSMVCMNDNLITASYDKTIRIWDLNFKNENQSYRIDSGHSREITSIFSNNKYLVTGSKDKHLLVRTFPAINNYYVLPGGPGYPTFLGIYDKYLIVGLHNKTKIWNLELKECIKIFNGDVPIAQYENIIVTHSSDRHIRIFNIVNDFRLIDEFEETKEVLECTINADYIAFSVEINQSFHIIIYNRKTHRKIQTTQGHNRIISSLIIINNYLISSSWDNSIKIWDLKTSELLRVLDYHNKAVIGLSKIPDTNLLVSSSYDRTLCIYDVTTNKVILKEKLLDYYIINANNKYIIAGSCDDVNNPELCLMEYLPLQDLIDKNRKLFENRSFSEEEKAKFSIDPDIIQKNYINHETDIIKLENDDVYTLFTKGNNYNQGINVPQNHLKANEFYLKAAKKGHIDSLIALSCNVINDKDSVEDAREIYDLLQNRALDSTLPGMFYLGMFLKLGIGCEVDLKLSKEWLLKAANLGDSMAMYELYETADNVDLEEEWLLKAAKNGNVKAMFTLGYFYTCHYKQDYEKAKKWFLKAAEKNNSEAMLHLSIIYSRYKGMENKDLATYWLEKSEWTKKYIETKNN